MGSPPPPPPSSNTSLPFPTCALPGSRTQPKGMPPRTAQYRNSQPANFMVTTPRPGGRRGGGDPWLRFSRLPPHFIFRL